MCYSGYDVRRAQTPKLKNRPTPWTKGFDMSTVPDEVLFAESARRMRARQKTAPRAEVLRPCPKCGAPFGARKLRAHIPGCTGAAVTNQNPQRVIRKFTHPKDQDAENYRYWQSRPVHERVAAVSELTQEHYALKGEAPDVPRLQRTLVRFERVPG